MPRAAGNILGDGNGSFGQKLRRADNLQHDKPGEGGDHWGVSGGEELAAEPAERAGAEGSLRHPEVRHFAEEDRVGGEIG